MRATKERGKEEKASFDPGTRGSKGGKHEGPIREKCRGFFCHRTRKKPSCKLTGVDS